LNDTNANTALSSVFAEELARCGVRLAVVSPGSRSTPLAVALFRQPGIEVEVVLDERSAGFFALGAAAAGTAPVVLLCTSGTAAANYHPAVAEADLSGVPLIVLTADRPPELRGIGAGQTIDQIKLFGSAVRWFSEVGNHDADDTGLLHMRATACRAFATAAGQPRPGPVHLNLPFRDPLDPSPVPGAVTATDPLATKGRMDGPLTAVPTSTAIVDPVDMERVVALANAAERVLIVAGRQADPALRGPMAALADRLGAVILAEPTSQLRLGPHDRSRVVSGYDFVAARMLAGSTEEELTPDLVLRVGETPTSKNLRIWLSGLRQTPQVVLDPSYGWYEPSRVADLILRTGPAELLASLGASGSGDTGEHGRQYVEAWSGAVERSIEAGSDSTGPGEPGPELITAPAVHQALGRSYRDGELVYTASSLAIREQESFLPEGDADVLFFSNRGANGIDGVIGSGIGAASSTGRPTTIVTGELGFQHDLGSLALLGGASAPVRIVVVNDNGGRIFSRLPQKKSMPAEEFETLMSTPSALNIKAAAALFSSPYTKVVDPAGLTEALEAVRSGVIEVVLPAG